MSNLVDKAMELQVMTCLDSLLNRANHDEYLQRIGKKEALRFLEENSKYAEIIKLRLQKLQSIENATPSEALKCFENMQYRIAANISTIEYTTIKQALLKAQEPKHYLKWSQIRDMPREFKVKMGNDIYVVKYEYWGATDIDVSLFQTNGLFMFNLHESFIENLHLEVIEE